MADGPVYATRMTEQALHPIYRLYATTGFDYSVWGQLATVASPEGREGISAALEGRKPNWPR
jgi:enoyl-CoA hydratase/carnithine racemase